MLLVFVLFTAVLLIGTYRILPKAVFEGQRQKEEELIFRGQQYRRAIQLYVRRFGRYPASLDDLEDTNDLRFIRKLYPDPMTPEGEWRLIHIAPGGVFPDALNPPGVQGPSPGASNPAEESSSGTSSRQSSGSSPESSTGFQQGLLGASAGQSDITEQGSANPPNAQQPRGTGLNPQAGAPQQGPVFGGGGLAGVASKNESEAIKRWNTYEHYNEWEFIYDYRADPLGLASINRASGQQTPAGPPQGGGAVGPGGRGPNNPFGLPGLPSAPARPGGMFPGVPPGAPFSNFPGGPPAPAQPAPGASPR
jgi:type II secretory pathway pseudopilin PulG